ncbi:MAG: hypothetical protein R3F12_02805 [Lysobacteraceae bacterium]
MAGKRKVFTKTDLSIPKVEHTRDAGGAVVIPMEVIPPATTLVRFEPNPNGSRSFDFAPFYGVGIDAITYACQRQIERFLAKQDKEVEVSTVTNYCQRGLKTFLDCLTLRAAALRRALTLADIDRDLIDGYLAYLRDSGVSYSSQKTRYDKTKSVLTALGTRGLIRLVHTGDDRTLPDNPYPHSNQTYKGATPLPRAQRQAFTQAVKTAVMPLFRDDVEVTGELLAWSLLIVALHTGRNTTPLLEMVPDCLRAHPKATMEFLVLWKRRGHNTSKVALRADYEGALLESTPTIKVPVVRLIRRVIALTADLRAEAPEHLSDRVWLYRSRAAQNTGEVTALNGKAIKAAVDKLVKDYNLTDANGDPFSINVSRLRKTFVNRMFELSDGDMTVTASAAGNTVQVAQTSYLKPGEDAQRNWLFLGQALTIELLTSTLGATERTPAGRCSDPTGGQYAPKKKDGTTCFSFLDCLRCRNYVVTGDDLYRLFSFFWRVLKEREQMDARQWDKHYAHIPRLIERDVIAHGLKKKMLKAAEVEAARERARHDPHPFWRFESLATLDAFRDRPEDAT